MGYPKHSWDLQFQLWGWEGPSEIISATLSCAEEGEGWPRLCERSGADWTQAQGAGHCQLCFLSMPLQATALSRLCSSSVASSLSCVGVSCFTPRVGSFKHWGSACSIQQVVPRRGSFLGSCVCVTVGFKGDPHISFDSCRALGDGRVGGSGSIV